MFKGSLPALVTPFEDGKVDMRTLTALVDWHVDQGSHGLVPVGTTGESPTLSHAEHDAVVAAVVETVAGRVPVIAGAGSNNTIETVRLVKAAKAAGADAALVVTPYYNKPTQEGLYRHFMKIADVGLPVMLYSIPGRCNVEIELETVARLAKHESIVAIKEAGGKVDRISGLKQCCDLSLLSGDDALALPMMLMGATGLVSVTSNLLPAEMTALTHYALAGDYRAALEIHFNYYRLFGALFAETNPVPVKAAMHALDLHGSDCRLPLAPMAEDNTKKLYQQLAAVGLIGR